MRTLTALTHIVTAPLLALANPTAALGQQAAAAAPLADKSGRVVKWCGTNTDIEERLKAQEDVTQNKVAAEALKASEAELRLAHAHLTVAQQVSVMGSFTSDLVADEHTWSDEFYRICAIDPGSKVTPRNFRGPSTPTMCCRFKPRSGAPSRATTPSFYSAS